MAVPTSDTGLRDYGANFGAKVTAAPADYSLTAAQATAFDAKYDLFIAALDAVAAARAAGVRSEPMTEAKDAAKAQLLLIARELYGLVQDSLSVSNENKLELGITVRDVEPTPVPVPGYAPGMSVQKTIGWTVNVRLQDTATPSRRGRPPGVIGAALFSYVGDEAPTSLSDWKFEGNTGRTVIDVVFPNTTAAGAKVWLTSFWFNSRKQSGPACAPISTNLPGGSVSMAA